MGSCPDKTLLFCLFPSILADKFIYLAAVHFFTTQRKWRDQSHAVCSPTYRHHWCENSVLTKSWYSIAIIFLPCGILKWWGNELMDKWINVNVRCTFIIIIKTHKSWVKVRRQWLEESAWHLILGFECTLKSLTHAKLLFETH